ncbi:LysE family transporter [Streptomyces sp. NPDC059224]|uniref:LysE family transporter n=1 Tax=Streptomyces sp. NPDC059224 TaxID=3346775 RepID=UPI0036749588
MTAGLLIRGALSLAGPAAVPAASATACTAVKLLGAAYLALLAIQALRQSRRGRAVTAPALPLAGNPWRTGLVGNVLNPKIAVFYTGLLPALAPSGFSPRAGTAPAGSRPHRPHDRPARQLGDAASPSPCLLRQAPRTPRPGPRHRCPPDRVRNQGRHPSALNPHVRAWRPGGRRRAPRVLPPRLVHDLI